MPPERERPVGGVVVVQRQADLLHVVGAIGDRRAASRADCTAGSKSEIRTAMMAMTTSSSISVKPRRDCDLRSCSDQKMRYEE